LTSFLLKTVEKLVDVSIRTQHAYRAGRSTDTALYHLKSLIEDSLTHKEVKLCVFLGLQGAFNNTSHEAVNASLATRGLDATTSRWIKSLLAPRRAMATIGGQSYTVSTTRGCPQGSVLSPLLWSLLVDELLERLNRRGILCQGYADDIVITARGKYEETLCDIIQLGLNMTSEWCKEVSLILAKLLLFLSQIGTSYRE